MASRFQLHVHTWQNCQLCALCNQRSHIVLARGTVPCDVLFIGEAPGQSEDVLGKPFIGPAGKLLDQIIETAWRDSNSVATRAFTNLVACFPKNAKDKKVNEPEPEEIKACEKRLAEFVGLCSPKLAVCVGKLSSTWVHKMRNGLGLEDTKLIDIFHPAAILRAGIQNQGLAVQKCVLTLTEALEDMTVKDIPF